MELIYHPQNDLPSIRGVYVTTLRRRQNGDISAAGGRVIGSSSPETHAATLTPPMAVLGHAKLFPDLPCQIECLPEFKAGVDKGISSLLENLDWCFAYTFKM